MTVYTAWMITILTSCISPQCKIFACTGVSFKAMDSIANCHVCKQCDDASLHHTHGKTDYTIVWVWMSLRLCESTYITIKSNTHYSCHHNDVGKDVPHEINSICNTKRKCTIMINSKEYEKFGDLLHVIWQFSWWSCTYWKMYYIIQARLAKLNIAKFKIPNLSHNCQILTQ